MDYLDIRKNAYIDALTTDKKIVSLWGRIPWEIVEAFDYKAIYSYGIDYEVTSNYHDNNYCDLLNSSFAYLEMDKCPFMHETSFFIVDDSCKIRYEKLKEKTKKEVYIYKDNDYKALIKYLEDKSKMEFDNEKLDSLIEKSKTIGKLILSLRKTDLDPKRIYEVEYFSKFIFDIDKRIDFIKSHIANTYRKKESVKIQAGGGIYKKIDQLIEEGYFCEGEYQDNFTKSGFAYIEEKYRKFDVKPDYVIRNCRVFEAQNNEISY